MPGVLLEPLTKFAERRTGGPSDYQRTLGTAIGRELRNYYDLSEPIPHRMLELLKQLDNHDVKPDDSTGAA
jgi:Anti-sigma factor NepR